MQKLSWFGILEQFFRVVKNDQVGWLHGFRTKSAAKTVQECVQSLKGAFSAPPPPPHTIVGPVGRGGRWVGGPGTRMHLHTDWPGWENVTVRSQCSACGRQCALAQWPHRLVSPGLRWACPTGRLASWAASCGTRGCPGASGLSPAGDGERPGRSCRSLSAAPWRLTELIIVTEDVCLLDVTLLLILSRSSCSSAAVRVFTSRGSAGSLSRAAGGMASNQW